MKTYGIGLMSGTSLDGVDVALIGIEGVNLKTQVEVIAYDTLKIDDEIKQKIIQAMDLNQSHSALLSSLNVELGYMFGHAVNQFIKDKNLLSYDISFISSHGQTIYHIPHNYDEYLRSSLQLGEGAVISEVCKNTVVSNFRLADIAAGGQGAPLVPFVDYILFSSKEKVRAIHNIGGIANTTILSKSLKLKDVRAWDSGPGNMMIDRACHQLYGKSYDKNGDIANSGKLVQALYDEIMHMPFFREESPKTTGRELFGDAFTDRLIKKYSDHKPEDIIYTLSMITIDTICLAYKDIAIDELYLCGGGAYNTFISTQLKRKLKNVSVKMMDELGIPADIKEAVSFAVLGHHTLKRKPSNVMHATGAKTRKILGQINYYK